MKKSIFIFIFFTFVAFDGISQQPDIKIFHKELGEEKTKAFKRLLGSFENFLSRNYPDSDSYAERLKRFLADMLKPEMGWTYNDSISKEVMSDMENSGLRKDIYIYDSEKESYAQYDIDRFLTLREEEVMLNEIDDNFEDIIEPTEISIAQEHLNKEREKNFQQYLARRPDFNNKGLFLYAYAKAVHNNESALVYVELKNLGVDLSCAIIGTGYLEHLNDEELDLWYYKIPIVLEVYYFDLLHKYVIFN